MSWGAAWQGASTAGEVEDVTLAADGGNGLDEPFRIQFLAQSAHHHLYGVGIPFAIPVELVQQLLLGDHLAGVAHQVLQDQILEAGEHGDFAGDGQLLAGEIQLVVTRLHPGGDETGAAAHQGIEAGQQLVLLEGLDQVVVRPGFQPFHLVLPVAPRGQHYDGEGDLLLAQAADELQAVHVRQAEIDDGHVDGVVGRIVQRHLGIVRAVNLILGLGQQRGEVVIEQLVVFDQ